MRPRADTLLVWTGAPCSYGCAACPIAPNTAPAAVSQSDLQRALATMPAQRGRLVMLVGGDPFLRPDLVRLIATIRAAGGAPGIVTTGRALMYPHVRQRLRRAGLAYLRLQCFGHGEAHDRATGVPGSFTQAIAGLRAWLDEATAAETTACDVDVALYARGRSIATVAAEIPQLAHTIAAPAVQLVVVMDPPSPHGSELLLQAMAPLAHWNDDPTRPLLAWEGLPEPASPAAHLTLAPLGPSFISAAPPACCLGRVEALVAATAARRQATVANSFNFVRTTETVPLTATAEDCTAHAAAAGTEPHRHLWLVEGDHLARHVTDTADFGITEIVRVKDDLSHLFLDRAPAGVLDDITDGMRRVLPDPTCEPCPSRNRCGRRYRLVEAPPFANEEAWIARYVASLRGRVLDVGCGEQLYRSEITPLVRSGAVRYHGLDPDAQSLDGWRAVLPEGRFHLGGIEDFRGEPASYDRILCLRSLNHVVDVDEAFARMAELLKPGGQLLVVECTAFAMLRRPEQVAAADRAPRGGHQHFRNLASEDVIPSARRHSLQVLEHRPSTLQTTNEWILLLARARAHHGRDAQ